MDIWFEYFYEIFFLWIFLGKIKRIEHGDFSVWLICAVWLCRKIWWSPCWVYPTKLCFSQLVVDCTYRRLNFPFNFFYWIMHCVESVQIRSYFWSVFSCIWTEYGDLLRIQSKYRKIWTRKKIIFGHVSSSDSQVE